MHDFGCMKKRNRFNKKTNTTFYMFNKKYLKRPLKYSSRVLAILVVKDLFYYISMFLHRDCQTNLIRIEVADV